MVVDGVKQNLTDRAGNPVCPAVYRDVVYLPMDVAGALCGMEATLVKDRPQTLYFRSSMTDVQRDELRAFYADSKRICTSLITEAEALIADPAMSNTKALEKLDAISGYLKELRLLDLPSAPMAQNAVHILTSSAETVEQAMITPLRTSLQGGATLALEAQAPLRYQDRIQNLIDIMQASLRDVQALWDAL